MRHPDPTSWIELSRDSFRHNLEFLRERIGPKTRFCSVVKGNAYGHGIDSFVPMAEEMGVDCFGVYDAFEADEVLRARRHDTDVLVMGMIAPEAIEWAIEQGVSFYVFDAGQLEHTIEFARTVGRPARIHLELETGMHRTGLEGPELDRAAALARDHPEQIELVGICTHFAGAESTANYHRITRQIARYQELVDSLRERGLVPQLHHLASSSATLTLPDTICDMVRVGIAHYGFWPSQEVRMRNLLSAEPAPKKSPLYRVLSWKSRVMGLKSVPAGDFVGYGTSYLAPRDERLAVIPVGYAHGFSRALGNKGHVLIRGKRAAVVGTVNMNMMMVDVTDIPGVEPGDEVVLIGEQGRREISVSAFTDLVQNVNYEMLTRLPEDIPRRVVD